MSAEPSAVVTATERRNHLARLRTAARAKGLRVIVEGRSRFLLVDARTDVDVEHCDSLLALEDALGWVDAL